MGMKISMADAFYDRCCIDYTLKYRDAGNFGHTPLGGGCKCSSYRIEGVGTVTLLRISVLFRTQEAALFVPDGKDAPVLMMDSCRKLGSETLTINIVDCMLNPVKYRQFEKIEENYAKLIDADCPETWYSGKLFRGSVAKKGTNEQLAEMLEDYMDAYLRIVEISEKCDPAEKAKKTAEFSDGLLNNGGPAADKAKKSLGAEKAKNFFDSILFPQ